MIRRCRILSTIIFYLWVISTKTNSMHNHKITCCFPRHTLRRALSFFHRNKLRIRRTRQVDLLVIKIKQVPFLLSSCSSLFRSHGSHQSFLFQHSISQTSEFRFCSFSILWHSVELTFSILSFANIKTCSCFFTGLYFPYLR